MEKRKKRRRSKGSTRRGIRNRKRRKKDKKKLEKNRRERLRKTSRVIKVTWPYFIYELYLPARHCVCCLSSPRSLASPAARQSANRPRASVMLHEAGFS